jgi:2-iminobutanoate/2-iminopropanoate deaminase
MSSPSLNFLVGLDFDSIGITALQQDGSTDSGSRMGGSWDQAQVVSNAGHGIKHADAMLQSQGETCMSAIIHHMLEAAPAPVAPFSHAVEVDGWVFVTGQIPENPENEDEQLPVGIEAQTRRVMDNLKLVLSAIGLGLEHVVSARVFVIDMREFETMNKIYASYFPPNKRPARTCIGVTGLAKGARVEIDFIARRV